MAVIWEKIINGKKYEVRSAGQTRRLYTDGVFHSQYNSRYSLTGNVWDLISLPSFFLERSQIRRILVLGVGGGAVIRQLRGWFPECHVTGIELDKTHLYIARRFFSLEHKNIDLIEADALQWVSNFRGLSFDIIIDDLFSEVDGEPERVVAAGKKWVSELSRILAPNGMLIINFISSKEFRASAFFNNQHLQNKYSQVFRFMTPLYENDIGVFLQKKSSVNEWRRHILDNNVLKKEFVEKQGKYQVRKISG